MNESKQSDILFSIGPELAVQRMQCPPKIIHCTFRCKTENITLCILSFAANNNNIVELQQAIAAS